MTTTTTTATRTGTGWWWGAWPGFGAQALLGSSVAVISVTNRLPVLGVQAARYALAAFAVAALARIAGVRLVVPDRRELVRVVGGALTGLVGFNLATILGTRHAGPAALGAAVACIPVVLALAGPLSQRRRPARDVVAGAVVVSLGAVLVTGLGGADPVGVAMGLALIGCEAAFTLFGAPVLPRMGAWSYSAATAAVAAVVFAVLSLLVERPAVGTFLHLPVIAAIAYLGVVATAVAFVLWFTGVRRLGPGTVGLCAGVAAPAAALVGAALGDPLPGPGAWVGMAVIAAGLVLGFGGVGGRGRARG
ncbi:MAG: DMT family transporter [Cellulomonas sp.]|nr:DMT family transporter [Cellulomonas sp.]